MRDVLAEYDDAVNQKGEEIRNRAAYLFGVVKRYKVVHERAAQGGGEFTPQGNLSDRVQVSIPLYHPIFLHTLSIHLLNSILHYYF